MLELCLYLHFLFFLFYASSRLQQTTFSRVLGDNQLAGRGELDFLRINLSTYEGRVFAYTGPTSWNSLRDNLKNVNLSLQTFKRHLKTFFFSSY